MKVSIIFKRYLTSRKRILYARSKLKSFKALAIVRCRHYANTSARSRPSYPHAEKLMHRESATVARLRYIH